MAQQNATKSAERLEEATEGDVVEFIYKSNKQITGGGTYRIESAGDEFTFEGSDEVWMIDDDGRVQAHWVSPVDRRVVVVQDIHQG